MNSARGGAVGPSVEQKRELLERLLHERAGLGADGANGAAPSAGLGVTNGRPAPEPVALHPFEAYINPHLGNVLRGLGLDKRFVRGEGCWLYDEQDRRYLDFMASYGALPFGYNPPEIWSVLQELAWKLEPSLVQPSAIEAAGELAKRLISVAPSGLRYVTFANSGAESVEVALKLARAATGRLGIVTTDNGFHGKTLGALSATGRTQYQRAFGAPVPGFSRVPYGDADALEAVLARRADEVAAFIVEPIQGEGGVITPPPGYLRAARDLCSRYGVLLIVDEVQTGLGRCGRLFACQEEGVTPDIMTLAKALGGGLVPAAAVLCTEACYTWEFGLKHTSTFAMNNLVCRVGLRVLDLLTRHDGALVRQVAENGAYLKARLEALRQRYPELIRAVRGRGYLLGLEFTTSFRSFGRQCLMGAMAEQDSLVPVICSYLLNVEGLRLAPTVLGASVMRVEPPLVATREMCDRFVASLERTLEVLRLCDSARLLAHLVGDGRRQVTPVAGPPPCREVPEPSPAQDEGRWAFIVHPLDYHSYFDLDDGLAQFSEREVKELVDRLNECRIGDRPSTLVMGASRIRSDSGATAFGEFIGISYTSDELLDLPTAEAVEHIREAVEVARERGARIVGLGAYTSVVTANALYLDGVGVPLTTGNTFTAVAAVEAVHRAAAETGRGLAEARVAILGASGSIGRAAAALLAEDTGRLILLGNPAHPARSLERLRETGRTIVAHLERCASEGRSFAPGTLGALVVAALRSGTEPAEALERLLEQGRIDLTVDRQASLPTADVVVTATSTPRALVSPELLKPGAVVCDVSRPSNVSPEVRTTRPDVLIVDCGIIELPGRQHLGVGIGLGPSQTYACMAETMILALERRYGQGTVGERLSEELVGEVRRLARQHGFRVA